jgi:hypothetical protein
MTGWILRTFSAAWTRLGQRCDLLLEFIALHHQLAVLQRTGTPRPCFRPSERLFWVLLSRWWANWQRNLIIVQPATVLRWRRLGLCAICLSGSCGHWRGGRPRINSEIRALIVRMSQENFLWGAPRIHGELLKLGFDVSQATVSRYMPRWGYPPTQTWRTFLRNQAFAIGAIGLGEAGRLSDELLALVRGWIELVVRCVTKVRNGIPCGFIERSSTLHPVPPYRSSNLTDWRDPHNGSTPVPPPPTRSRRPHTLDYGRSTAFSVSLEGITETEAAGIQKFCTTNRYCAHPPGEPRSMGRYAARLPRTTRSKTNDPQCPCPTPRPFYESAVADKVLRKDKKP